MKTLQIKLFMQNKAKFRKVKFNVNRVLTKDYDIMDTWSIRTKQSQTNPNKAKFKKAKMNVTLILTKDYENKPPIWAPKKQSQTSKRQKTTQLSLPKRIMKETRFWAPAKQSHFKPKQTQFPMILAYFSSRAKYMLPRLTINNWFSVEEHLISLSICPLFLLYSGIQMCIFKLHSKQLNIQQRSRK